MKFVLVIAFFVSLITFCFSMGTPMAAGIKTGKDELDEALDELKKKSRSPQGAAELEAEIKKSVSPQNFRFLKGSGFHLVEIYYFSLLSNHTGKNIKSIAAMRNKGVGWGVLAKDLAVQPSALNKFRVAIRKYLEASIKGRKKSRGKIKAAKKQKVKVKI